VRSAIVVAGGSGERFGRTEGKQLTVVAGKPLVSHTLEAFERAELVERVILVAHPNRVSEYRESAVERFGFSKVRDVVAGGSTRQESVGAGVRALERDSGHVAVHDGARPLVRPGTIDKAFRFLAADGSLDGVVVGHPVYDTLKECEDGLALDTVDRSRLWVAQTPQVFSMGILSTALRAAATDGFSGTDDAALVSRIGGRVALVEGPRDNIKVTVPEDMAYVEWVLTERSRED
jgi:2-C-methyl-D-erythritol 4-phosphate cytidylyltransferase